MVENIAIVGLNRSQAYEVGKMLATQLEMQFLDCVELFEFDYAPRTLTDMLKEYGQRYYREKEKGTLKYAAGFTETVINLESGMAKKENFATIKKNCLLIYLHNPATQVVKNNARQTYRSPEEKRFFNVPYETIKRRIEQYKHNADITINASGCSALKITSEALRRIKAYYNC